MKPTRIDKIGKERKEQITKKELKNIYSKPIDPLNPFERLTYLMDWAIQKTKPQQI